MPSAYDDAEELEIKRELAEPSNYLSDFANRARKAQEAINKLGAGPPTYQPKRGDAVEAWLRSKLTSFMGSDSHPTREEYQAFWVVNDLLKDYRLHADTGTPLNEEVT